jgi:hypothetical protein
LVGFWGVEVAQQIHDLIEEFVQYYLLLDGVGSGAKVNR